MNTDRPVYKPSEAEIAERAAEIRATWSPHTLESRLVGEGPVPVGPLLPLSSHLDAHDIDHFRRPGLEPWWRRTTSTTV